MITIRLDKEIEKSLLKIAKLSGVSKSELVRRSILKYLGSFNQRSAWELGKDLFGSYSSGKGTLSMDAKKIFSDKLRSKLK